MFLYNGPCLYFFFLFSAENGEKAEKEAEAEPEAMDESPEEKKEETVKVKAKKDKRSAEEQGFELWNELDVQRNKFMVRKKLVSVVSWGIRISSKIQDFPQCTIKFWSN